MPVTKYHKCGRCGARRETVDNEAPRVKFTYPDRSDIRILRAPLWGEGHGLVVYKRFNYVVGAVGRHGDQFEDHFVSQLWSSWAPMDDEALGSLCRTQHEAAMQLFEHHHFDEGKSLPPPDPIPTGFRRFTEQKPESPGLFWWGKLHTAFDPSVHYRQLVEIQKDLHLRRAVEQLYALKTKRKTP